MVYVNKSSDGKHIYITQRGAGVGITIKDLSVKQILKMLCFKVDYTLREWIKK